MLGGSWIDGCMLGADLKDVVRLVNRQSMWFEKGAMWNSLCYASHDA